MIEVDNYGSVWPSAAMWPDSAALFGEQLAQAIDDWTAVGHQRVWLRLTADQAELIPIALQHGFTFHRVQTGDLFLLRPLQADALPPPHQASHHVGTGGLVLNDEGEMLVIAERNGGHSGSYKIPGGYVEPQEHIGNAIVREIGEETGIEAQFESIALVRHIHNALYGNSNLYFICRLRALTTAITIDPEEIAECRWMSIESFMQHERTQAFHKAIVRSALAQSALVVGRLPAYNYQQAQVEFFLPTGVVEDDNVPL